MVDLLASRRSDGEAERLAAVGRYAILDTPPDGAFDRVCALAARYFRVPMASVTIVDEDRIWFKACEGLHATETAREPGLCASAILQDAPYVVTDGLTDARTVANPLVRGELGVRFYAAAPITTPDGYRLGTINVIDTEPREVTEQETQTLRDLAAIVMDELELRLAAIREVQRERERGDRALQDKRLAQDLARSLQRSLSPPVLPRVPGLDLAAHYQPFAAEEVGGDFYDIFPLAAGRWGFFLGDVCGKGPDAATLTSLARYTLRAAAMLNEEPAAILTDLNAALLLERPDELLMCTVVYGQIDTADVGVKLSLAVAGHPPPLVVRARGEVDAVDSHGPLLGAIPDPAFPTSSITLGPGDAIVLYSDGILDVDLAGAPIDEERLARLLAGWSGTSASDLIAPLRGALEDLDKPARDDVAILALSVRRAG